MEEVLIHMELLTNKYKNMMVAIRLLVFVLFKATCRMQDHRYNLVLKTALGHPNNLYTKA